MINAITGSVHLLTDALSFLISSVEWFIDHADTIKNIMGLGPAVNFFSMMTGVGDYALPSNSSGEMHNTFNMAAPDPHATATQIANRLKPMVQQAFDKQKKAANAAAKSGKVAASLQTWQSPARAPILALAGKDNSRLV
jgi:hypothetical protein